jgi:hypothetical protein
MNSVIIGIYSVGVELWETEFFVVVGSSVNCQSLPKSKELIISVEQSYFRATQDWWLSLYNVGH